MRLASKACFAILVAATLSAPAKSDYVIQNGNIAIGVDEFFFPGNLLSFFDFVGGRLDTGGPHDFWFDGFSGFASTNVGVRDGGGVLLALVSDGLGWASGPIVSHQPGAGYDSAVIEGNPMAGLFFRRVVRIDAGTHHVRVTDTFRNDSGMFLNPGVLDNVDPRSPFTHNTFNDILSVLGIGDFATATISPTNDLTVGFGSDDPAFRFSALGSTVQTNPFTVAPIDPNGGLVDNTLLAASDFGVLMPGAEVSHTWYIAFGTTKAGAVGEYTGATGVTPFSIGPVGNQFVDEHVEMVVSVPFNNPAGPITWSVNGPSGMTIDSSGVVRWTPGELDGGNAYPVEVEANDGSSVASTSFTVNVVETNSNPSIDPTGDQEVDEGDLVTVTFTASDPDVPVQGLTFSIVSAPSGATIHSATGLFQWTTNESHGPGVYPITVRVRDDGPGLLTDETTFNVTVNEVNLAPTIDPIANASVAVGETVARTATASDPDLPAQALTFSLVSGPAGASINAGSGAFSWTPGAGDVGIHTIEVMVSDDGDPVLSDSTSFTVEVTASTLTYVYTGATSGEYSDPVTLSALIKDTEDNPIPGLQLTFTLGSFVGNATTNSNGVASLTTVLNQPAGNPGVTVHFAGNATWDPFTYEEPFEILREKVIVSYFGDTALETAGPQSDSGTARFFLSAFQENDGNPGDFSSASLELKGFLTGNPGPIPNVFVGPIPIDGFGRAAAFRNVAAGVYNFHVSTGDSPYWRVVPAVSFGLTIKQSIKAVEGSGTGWIPFGVGNGHASMNFKVSEAAKKANSAKSSFAFSSADGYNYDIEVTHWSPGSLIFGMGSNAWKSAHTATARVRKVHRTTGQTIVVDDCPVTFNTWDGGRAAPSQPDAYGMVLLDPNGYIWIDTTVLSLGGGNIMFK